uniref:Protein-lysine N-methyltransferase EEF2KMT n=1 Tax=Sarcoptes scabiei TaxID=52283 RepID=A0A834REE8_SARSC
MALREFLIRDAKPIDENEYENGLKYEKWEIDADLQMINRMFRGGTLLKLLIPFIRTIMKNKIEEIFRKETKIRLKLLGLQKAILDVTIWDDQTKRYPLSSDYQERFSKLLIVIFETLLESEYIYTRIYEYYTSILVPMRKEINAENFDSLWKRDYFIKELRQKFNDPNLSNFIGFVAYYIDQYGPLDSMEVITLEYSKFIAVFSTTGLRTWPASYHLFEFIRNTIISPQSEKFRWHRLDKDYRWKNILELGSGSGSLGICLVKTLTNLTEKNRPFEGFRYIFTDNSNEVLQHIKLNLFINNMIFSSDENDSDSNFFTSTSKERKDRDQIAVRKFDWCQSIYDQTDSRQALEIFSSCDLIIGSDIVFDISRIEPLIKSLSEIFRISMDSHELKRPPDCLLCCTMRDPKLLEIFEEEVRTPRHWLKATIIDRCDRPKTFEKIFNHLDQLPKSFVEEENIENILKSMSDNQPSVIYRIESLFHDPNYEKR